VLLSSYVNSQTSSTGALTGVTLDASGVVLPGVVIRLVKQQTNEFQSGTSDEQVRFSFLLLSPGLYQVEAHHPPSGILQARAAIAGCPALAFAFP